jgi:tetratricopeptide (TPR) repeat protein
MTLSLLIKGLDIPEDRVRAINPKQIDELAEAIDRIGLLNPIIVKPCGGMGYRLISGLHRVKAFEKLGRDTIPAESRDVSDDEARLIEITENLHRAELTYLEKAEHVRVWQEYLEAHPKKGDENESTEVSAHNAQKPQGKISSVTNAGGRPTGGTSQLARDLNLDRDEVRRDLKIASIEQQVKDAIIAAGLDNYKKALLAISKLKEKNATLEEQLAAVQSWKERRERDKNRPTKSSGRRKKAEPEPSTAEPKVNAAEDTPEDEEGVSEPQQAQEEAEEPEVVAEPVEASQDEPDFDEALRIFNVALSLLPPEDWNQFLGLCRIEVDERKEALYKHTS